MCGGPTGTLCFGCHLLPCGTVRPLCRFILGFVVRACIGATSSSHSHSKPRCSHSWQTHLHSCHCSRYRRQHARGGSLLPGSQPVKPLFDAANLTIFWQTATASGTHDPDFPKIFARLRRGFALLRLTPPPCASPFSLCQNFNVLISRALPGSPAPAPCFVLSLRLSFRPFSFCASRRFRLTLLSSGRPRKRRGATSSTQTHSKPRSSHTRQTHPHTCHCSRYRRQHARGGLSA